MNESAVGQGWKVGELATVGGLTVRTLHHYDEIGLLVPSERTPAGHRLYGSRDVERLYRILALRHLGMKLDEIRTVLAGGGDDPRPTLRRHLEMLEGQLELNRRLRERLVQIIDALDRADDPSIDAFLEALEVMKEMDEYDTTEQLADLQRRRNELGEDGMQRAQQEWADLIAEAEDHMNKGTDPASAEVQAIVRKWEALIQQFTGGDPGLRASLQKMYEDKGPQEASRGMVNPELMEYIGRGMSATD